MQDKNLTIAINIDDILLDDKGKLKTETIDCFKNADKQNTSFILITNGPYKIAQNTIKQIKNDINGQSAPQFWVIANGGSQIYSPLGKVIQNQTFDSLKLMRLVSFSRCVDNACTFIYSTDKGNFIQVPDCTSVKLALWIYKIKDKKRGDCAFNLQEIEGFRMGRNMDAVIDEIGQINKMYAISFDKDSKRKVQYALKKEAKLCGAFAYSDKYTEVTTTSKYDAIKLILETAEQSPQNIMAKNVEDVVYIGNTISDVECLQKCNISATCGEQACSYAKSSSKYKTENLSHFMNNVYSGLFDVFMENIEKEEPKSKGRYLDRIFHMK